MSEPITLETLNWDVLLEIIQHDLDAQDLHSLSQVSRRLRAFTMDKSPWLLFLRHFANLHPLPLPPSQDLSTLAVSELQDLATHANNLHLNWLSDEPIPKQAYKVVSLRPHESIVSMLQLPRLPYIITLMKDGLVSCLSIDSGKQVSQYKPRRLVSSWRMESLEDDSVIVVLLVGPEDRSSISPHMPAEFVTLHLIPPDDLARDPGEFVEVSSYPVTSPVTGLFTTPEIAGVVTADLTTRKAMLLVASLNVPHSITIDTGILISEKPSGLLNAVAQFNDLLLYREESGSASLYIYNIQEEILSLMYPARNTPHFHPPSHHSTYKLHPDQLCEDAQSAYTIVRTKGRAFKPFTSEPHSPPELSVLTMSFVLGQDANGEDDHRCISHMYIHPSKLNTNERISHASRLPRVESPLQHRTATGPAEDDAPSTPSSSSSSRSTTSSPSTTASSTLADESTPDDFPQLQTFHSCLEEKAELWQGPGRNDLISVGSGASYAVWVSLNGQSGPELKLASLVEPDEPVPHIKRASASHNDGDEDDEHEPTHLISPTINDPNTAPQAVPTGHPNSAEARSARTTETSEGQGSTSDRTRAEASEWSIASMATHAHSVSQPHRKAMRTLKLPLSINPLEITAVTLEDTTGTLAIATSKKEIWLLDYAVSPKAH